MSEKTEKSLPVYFEGRKLDIAIIAAAAVTAVGLALWAYQLIGGMDATGMRNLDNWGLYMMMFMLLVGLSAGGLIISSIPKALGIKGFGGISKIAVWSSICCTVLAIAFVVVDMGHPFRVWELFVYANLSSPLMWDVFVLLTYLVISCVYLRATVRAEKGLVSQKALRVISVIALVCAVMVHTVTAWIFGLQASRELWHTALLGPWFVSSALVSGTALVMIAAVALRKVGYMLFDQGQLVRLAKLLGAFCVVDLYFFGCDLLTAGYPGAEGAEVVEMLLFGNLCPFFWAEVALTAFAAACCFFPQARTTKMLVGAAAAAIVAIFCKRVQLIIGGFQIANLGYAGPVTSMTVTSWEAGWAGAYQGMVYWPTMLEFGVVLGVLALGILLFLLGIKHLPLKPGGEER